MEFNDRVLITGGTGFIGGRLVEALGSHGVRLRIATSDFRHCARASCFPVELVKADLRDHDSLKRAVADCDIVFHLGYHWGGDAKRHKDINLNGTRVLAEEFAKNRGRRFVHVSSVAVYGNHQGSLTEETPSGRISDPYSVTKQKIEQVLLALHRDRGLPVAILQPTIVYGPYGSFWTTHVLNQVRSNRIPLPAGGSGLCNAVYVDDIVAAAILAAQRDASIGEKFLISGPSPTTWREFYAWYERMLNKEAVVALDNEQLARVERTRIKNKSLMRRLFRAVARRPELREYLLSLPPQRWMISGANRILPGAVSSAIQRACESLWTFPSDAPDGSRPLLSLPEPLRTLYASHTYVKIDKARSKIGYNPAFTLEEGMARTAAWARWANLLST